MRDRDQSGVAVATDLRKEGDRVGRGEKRERGVKKERSDFSHVPSVRKRIFVTGDLLASKRTYTYGLEYCQLLYKTYNTIETHVYIYLIGNFCSMFFEGLKPDPLGEGDTGYTTWLSTRYLTISSIQ